MPYTLQDIIDGAVENEPLKIQAAFDELISPKIVSALEARKQQVAQSLFDADEEEGDETIEQEVSDEDTETASEEN